MGGRGGSGGAGAPAGLPKLKGTEKQVSWATDIRAGAFKALDDIESKIRGNDREFTSSTIEGVRIVRKNIKKEFGEITDAGEIIKNRSFYGYREMKLRVEIEE